ncbi:MAG TPA: DUF3040 domain-containing protein [Acidimicrobiales bacterium]|nr:DUF3040 domain-containing protein [Acidimicrobiales bacterium]
MPLSEHEQRVLRQIERQFQQERGLARPLRMPADPKEASRNAKRAAIGFVIGLLALLISFSSSWVVGLIGFLAMLASAVVLVQSLRRLAQHRWGPRPAATGGRDEEGGRSSGRRWPGWGAAGGRRQEDDSF